MLFYTCVSYFSSPVIRVSCPFYQTPVSNPDSGFIRKHEKVTDLSSIDLELRLDRLNRWTHSSSFSLLCQTTVSPHVFTSTMTERMSTHSVCHLLCFVSEKGRKPPFPLESTILLYRVTYQLKLVTLIGKEEDISLVSHDHFSLPSFSPSISILLPPFFIETLR